MRHHVLLWSCLILALGCASPDEADEPADAEFDTFGSGKADGLCIAAGTPAGLGVLALVNDPNVDVDELDISQAQGGAGLNRRAAQNIVAARPIADLEELDAVPWVGVTACAALAEYACNEQRRCLAAVDVMTWNLEHFPKSDVTQSAVAEILTELRPDIVGVQEVESSTSIASVVNALPGYAHLLGKNADTRVALLYRQATIEVTKVEDLFAGDSYAFPRPVLAVTARLRAALDPTEVVFVVVHLKALSGAANEARRRSAVGKLRTWIDDRRDAGSPNIVVIGDWNDRIEESQSTNVFGKLLEASADVEFLTAAAADSAQYSFVPFQSLIDHIVATDEALDVLVDPILEVLPLDETWDGDYIDDVTDHRPVRARFGLPIGY